MKESVIAPLVGLASRSAVFGSQNVPLMVLMKMCSVIHLGSVGVLIATVMSSWALESWERELVITSKVSYTVNGLPVFMLIIILICHHQHYLQYSSRH